MHCGGSAQYEMECGMAGKEGKTYASSGVDLDYADQLSDHFSKLLPTTFRKGCLPWAGGFAGMFDLKREGLDDAIFGYVHRWRWYQTQACEPV